MAKNGIFGGEMAYLEVIWGIYWWFGGEMRLKRGLGVLKEMNLTWIEWIEDDLHGCEGAFLYMYMIGEGIWWFWGRGWSWGSWREELISLGPSFLFICTSFWRTADSVREWFHQDNFIETLWEPYGDIYPIISCILVYLLPIYT